MENPLFSILIVLYNSPLKYVEKNIKNTYKASVEYVVVDNSVNDEFFKSINEWRNSFQVEIRQKIQIIRAPKNGGYSEGNNIAFRYSKGKYLLILNPDMILDNSFLENAQHILQERNWGILAAKIIDLKTNELQCGRSIFTPTSFRTIVNLPGSGKPNTEEKKYWLNFYAHGGCITIRRELFKQLRGFDPIFFMYTEETDLCYRAAKIGQKPVLCPQLKAYHENSSHHVSLFSHKYMTRNNVLFFAKNFSFPFFILQSFLSIIRMFASLVNLNHLFILDYPKILPLFLSIKDGILMGMNIRLNQKFVISYSKKKNISKNIDKGL